MQMNAYVFAKLIGCKPQNIYMLIKKDPPRIIRNAYNNIDTENEVNAEYIRAHEMTVPEFEKRHTEYLKAQEKKKAAQKIKQESVRRRKQLRKSPVAAELRLEEMEREYQSQMNLITTAIWTEIEQRWGSSEVESIKNVVGRKIKEAMGGE